MGLAVCHHANKLNSRHTPLIWQKISKTFLQSTLIPFHTNVGQKRMSMDKLGIGFMGLSLFTKICCRKKSLFSPYMFLLFSFSISEKNIMFVKLLAYLVVLVDMLDSSLEFQYLT